jgi:hypothetical protein
MNGIHDAGTFAVKRITTGRLYFRPNGASYEEDLGNVVKWKRNDRTERIEHLASAGGVRRVDMCVVHTVAFGYLITVDEYTDPIVQLLQKTRLAFTQSVPAATGRAIAIPVAIPGKVYPLNAQNVANVAVTQGATTLLPGSDYLVDAAAGRLTLLASGPNAGALTGASLTVTFNQLPWGFINLPSGDTPTLQGTFTLVEYDQQSSTPGAVPIVRAVHTLAGSADVNGDSEDQTTAFRSVDIHLCCWNPPVVQERI